jgi:hypothetical protein
MRLYGKWKSDFLWRVYSELSGKIAASGEKREDAFLEIASNERDPLAVVVYGHWHAWGGKESFGKHYKRDFSIRDNLAIWNSEHLDKKFSLIEITPIGVRE